MAESDPVDELASALIALIGALNNPRQDDVLLHEAGVSLDRALFPLVVRLGALGPMGVVELADHAGRDHTTISRQLAVLVHLGLVGRRVGRTDRRVREAVLTAAGRQVARRIADARRRLLRRLLESWSTCDRQAFARLARTMADDMTRLREEIAPPT